MRLLLDTQIFLWAAMGSAHLSSSAAKLLEASKNELYLSTASVWEMAIKSSLGKLKLKMPVRELVDEAREALALTVLDITAEIAAEVERMPFHHRDPFDRLIVAHAFQARARIVSSDAALKPYLGERLVLV